MSYKFRCEGDLLTGYLGDINDKDIFIPEKISKLRKYALSNLNCNSIYFPKSLSFATQSVIYNCKELTEVTFKESPAIIDPDFLEDCPNVENINIIGSSLLYKSEKGIVLTRNNDVHIIPMGLKGEVTIPEGPTTFETQLLNGRKKITKLILPHSLKSLFFSRDVDAPSLEEIVIQENVYSMNDSFFERFDGKVKITINPENPYYKKEGGALYNVKEKTLFYLYKDYEGDLVVPSFVTRINNWIFENSKIKSITTPPSLLFSDSLIDNRWRKKECHLFKNMPNLTHIDIQNRKSLFNIQWFENESEYFSYLLNREDRINHSGFIRFTSSFYPSQLEKDDRLIVIKEVVNLFYSDMVTEEWKKAWVKEVINRIKTYKNMIIDNKALLLILIKEAKLNMKDITLLLEVANERGGKSEEITLLLEYQKEHFDTSDPFSEKEKEMERELFNSFLE